MCNGSKITSSQFLAVGGTGIDLQSIIPQGEDCSDNLIIQTFDALGATIDTYYWVEWYGESGDEKCWIDGVYSEKVEGVVLKPGIGVWLQASSDAQFVQTSGEVNTKDITVQLCDGSIMLCNQSPVDLDLQDILPSGPDCSDNLIIQTFDELGGTIDTYYWVEWYGESGDEKCWIDGVYSEKVEGVKIAPGTGVWLQATSSEQFVTLPGVEL